MAFTGTAAASLFVKIGADLKDFNKGMDEVSKSMVTTGEAISKVGKTMSTYVTLPIVAAGAMMIKTASDAEEMRGKFGVVFGELENDMRSWASESAKAWNRSQIDLEGYLANLQNMFVGFGMARSEGAEFSKQVVQMGVDLASFNNLAESDALRQMESALVGNHEAARSLGAILNDNTLSLAMQEMGLQGTFLELEENVKMQVRYQAIVMQSTDAIGDAERTSGSFSNQLKGLQASTKDMAVSFGELLLPAVTKIVGVISDVINTINSFPAPVKNAIVITATFAAAIGPLLSVTGKVIALFGKLPGMIGLISKAATALIPVLTGLSIPILPLIAGLAAVIALGVLIVKNWEKIKESAKNLVDALKLLNPFRKATEDVKKEIEVESGSYGVKSDSMNNFDSSLNEIDYDIPDPADYPSSGSGGIGSLEPGQLSMIIADDRVLKQLSRQLGDVGYSEQARGASR
jgi:hypothetical protein